MDGYFCKDDLRIKKTHKSLLNAMFEMLSHRNFNDITVSDICSEALISRAAFYSHFNDKYDFLRYLLAVVRADIIEDVYKYDELERTVNQFVLSNKRLIANILNDANGETLALVREFMSVIIESAIKRKTTGNKSAQHIILFNFIAGGLTNLLMYIVENNFPPDINIINTYIYQMIEEITIWDAKQENKKDE